MNFEQLFNNPFFFWPLYFLPFIVGCLRRSQNLGLIFFVNLTMAWTVIGWIVAWALVFSGSTGRVLRPLVEKYQRSAAPGSPAPAPGMGQAGSDQAPQPRTCTSCTNGRMTCPMCRGTPNRYEPPQGANGSPQLVSCGYCSASGTVQCTTCGGSGKVW